MNRVPLSLFALLAAAGCVGDPDLAASVEGLELRTPVERTRWELAPAGCEDVARQRGLRLRPTQGEPMLGALVDPLGDVRCVDALTVLIERRDRDVVGGPDVEDPTPTPLTPWPDGVLQRAME